MNLGDAFLMKVPPRNIPHFFIVISDPANNGGAFIIVNITGDRFMAGEECILNIGDHPWITKKSYLMFSNALEITPAHAIKLNKLIEQKKIKPQPSVSPSVLGRIVEAAKIPTAITENFKKYL
jgi:hypothetical protein